MVSEPFQRTPPGEAVDGSTALSGPEGELKRETGGGRTDEGEGHHG